MPASSRLTSLDALRGLAAALVVTVHIFHHALSPTSWYAQNIFFRFDIGHFGVLLFFCISGFVIPLSLEGRTLTQFWWGRVTRLYPAYWASIGTALLLWSLGRYESPLVEIRPAAIVANLTMVQVFIGYGPLLTTYWSLLVELVFYVLACVVVCWRWRWDVVALVLVGLALVAPETPDHLALLVYLPLMCCGALIHQAWCSRQWRRALLVSLVITLAMVPLSRHSAAQILPTRLVVVWVFAGVMYLTGERRWPWPLVWLGRISYSLYLFHVLVIAALPEASVVVWIIGSVGVAWLSYRYVEQPALALSKRRDLRSKNPAKPDWSNVQGSATRRQA